MTMGVFGLFSPLWLRDRSGRGAKALNLVQTQTHRRCGRVRWLTLASPRDPYQNMWAPLDSGRGYEEGLARCVAKLGASDALSLVSGLTEARRLLR